MIEQTINSIVHGSQVTMHFAIYLEDGTEADGSFGSDPFAFTMGDGSMIDGLERALYGLSAGDKQSLLIPPQEGFGFRDEDSIQTLPRSDFAPELPLEPGVIIGFDTPAGVELPGMILEVNDKEVVVDFNHPLAGHEIRFDVEILGVDNSHINEQESD